MMGWYGNGWGTGMLFVGLFCMLVVAGAVWAFVRWATRTQDPQDGVRGSTHESPREILDRRFASGELDTEQYGQARRLLDGRGVDDARR